MQAEENQLELPPIQDGLRTQTQNLRWLRRVPFDLKRSKELLMGPQMERGVTYWRGDIKPYCPLLRLPGRSSDVPTFDEGSKRDMKTDLQEFMDAKEKLLGPVLQEKTGKSCTQEESAKVFNQPLIKKNMGRLSMLNRYLAGHPSVTQRDSVDLSLLKKNAFSRVPLPRSTYDLDFNFDFPLEKISEYPDCHFGFRKCISQVIGQDGWQRRGRNTWWDESGIFNTTHFARQMQTAPRVFPYMDRIKYKDEQN